MPTNYLATDTDLTSVANAIRAKSGGSSQLAFPAGFVSEIQAIPSGGGGRLPQGYTELEYIETSGTQYINLNYHAGEATEVVLYCQTLKHSGDSFQCLIGAVSTTETSATPPTFYAYIGSAMGITVEVRQTSSGDPVSLPAVNYEDKILLYLSNASAIINNQEAKKPRTTGTGLTAVMNYPLYLFARNHGNTLTRALAVGRVYSLDIYANGILMRHYVPAMRDSDDEIGLYETENDVFYTNAGTGSFTGSVLAQNALSVLLGGAT